MSLESVTALVEKEFELLKEIIKSNVQSNVKLADNISSHIISGGGKRVRPLLVLLCAKACDYQGENHIYPAAAIEYFHTATLLHDDVLDESKLRRGTNTAHTIWGSKASILVGDILLTQSVKFMTYTKSMPMLEVLIDAAYEITKGEVKQLSNTNLEQISIDEYFEVIRAKTALLFSAATEIAAIAANQNEVVRQQLQQFGLHIGNAFQIIDDLLDYQASTQDMGKKAGDDLRDGKITLPFIYALEGANDAQTKLLKTSIKSQSEQQFNQVVEIMEQTLAFEKTLSMAKNEVDSAISCLEVLPDSEYKDALITISQFVIQRSH